ncbi:acetoacetate--CoA ligase [uncultured Microbacterium sp.]|uniref:acetoacetate--CoA ligase n=1 Tax=uncultured Microbacterium sp. TaxID=191216 RepID=UPI0028D1094E|nr:acetoacetate--CoA ligase [uncultured Microbacterium sp.]
MIVDADAPDGGLIWRLDDALVGATGVSRLIGFLRSRGHALPVGDYDELWQWSVDDVSRFWSEFAEFSGVALGGAGDQVRTEDPMPQTRWFPGRTVNFARHLLEQDRAGAALIAVAEDGARTEMTWSDLRAQVGAFSRFLRERGIGEGDRVVGILPNVIETVIAFLGAAAIGAVWSVCAPEFGAGAIVSRFAQLEPKIVVAVPGYRLGGRDRDRTGDLGEIFAALPSVTDVVWVTAHTDTDPPFTAALGAPWHEAVSSPADLEFAEVPFAHPLWVMFSSGTTGKPKGIVHGHGGALLEMLKLLSLHSDLRPGDRYLNVASTSWVLWNSLVSALGVGATPVLMDGNPTYPSLDRVWEVVAAERVAALGIGAGFVHSCLKADLVPLRDHDLAALRAVQVTGSPLSADGFRWVYRCVGDVWLSSMSGGTDIASIFVGGAPTLPVRVGYIQAPALGVRVESWDERGRPATGQGELVVTEAMPSMPLFFWGDDDGTRYQASYFSTYPAVWRHGDYIQFDEHGILILGRSDSTLNRNGLRLGSADIYAAVEQVPEVREALVVGAEIGTDYYMPLFVALTDEADPGRARAAITSAIRSNLSARYLPDEVIFVRGIPHTRTGKKLEVPVKRLLQGAALEDVADLGAIDDPSLLQDLAEFARSRHAVG